MSYTKKKRRKKRQPQQYELPETQEEKDAVQYRDEFQKNFGSRVEDFGNKFEGKGKQIMYAVAALAVLVIIAGIFFTYQRRQTNLAKAALGDAIETSQAQVTDSPVPAGSTIKVFKTEKARSEAAINEFQAVSEKYGGEVGDQAKYFIAVNRLKLDRNAGITELQGLAGNSGEIGIMSKFALAQAYADESKFDEAVKLYQELSGLENSFVAKETINLELAKIYEKQNKTKEAADLYFNIAKEASEAKDYEGKPVPLSQTANEAKAKLEEIAPDRAKEIPQPETPAPGLPLG